MINYLSNQFPSERDFNKIISVKKSKFDLGKKNFKGRMIIGELEFYFFSEEEINAPVAPHEIKFYDTLNV
jgi:hypothetical protein